MICKTGKCSVNASSLSARSPTWWLALTGDNQVEFAARENYFDTERITAIRWEPCVKMKRRPFICSCFEQLSIPHSDITLESSANIHFLKFSPVKCQERPIIQVTNACFCHATSHLTWCNFAIYTVTQHIRKFIMKKTKFNNEILALDFGFNQRWTQKWMHFSAMNISCVHLSYIYQILLSFLKSIWTDVMTWLSLYKRFQGVTFLSLKDAKEVTQRRRIGGCDEGFMCIKRLCWTIMTSQ